MTIYALYRRALALSQGQYAALMDKMDSPGMDSHSLCLPLEREFADLRIHYCEFLLKLLRLHAVEADRVRQIARSKDNLELAHDVFLQDEVNHYDLSDEAQIAETKWARLCTELPDEIAQTLLEAQSLVRYHKSTITARVSCTRPLQEMPFSILTSEIIDFKVLWTNAKDTKLKSSNVVVVKVSFRVNVKVILLCAVSRRL